MTRLILPVALILAGLASTATADVSERREALDDRLEVRQDRRLKAIDYCEPLRDRNCEEQSARWRENRPERVERRQEFRQDTRLKVVDYCEPRRDQNCEAQAERWRENHPERAERRQDRREARRNRW